MIGGVLFAWPLAVHPQQPDRMRRVRVLMGNSETDQEAQERLRRPRWEVVANPPTTRWPKPSSGCTIPRSFVDATHGPWRHLEAVEYATLERIDWFYHRRLLEPIGNVPPAEFEASYHQSTVQLPMSV